VPPGYTPPPSPADGQANWIVIEVGKIQHRNVSRDVRAWLRQAKKTERRDAPPAITTMPATTDGYKLCGQQSAYSPDGRFLATAENMSVNLYDPTTLALKKSFSSLLRVRWFKFSPCGKRLLVVQRFGDVRDLVTMWDVETGRPRWSRAGPGRRIAFSPDGRRFLGHSDRAYSHLSVLWDAESGEVLCVVVAPNKLAYNTPVFGPDGASLCLGTPEGPRIWPGDR